MERESMILILIPLFPFQNHGFPSLCSFIPTITTWTGSYRSMRAYVAKHQSMQLKNSTQVFQ